VAQAILESGYGGKVPTDINTGAYSYNLFGIKGKGPAGSVLIPTTEYIARKKVGILANFRAYNSFTESISGRTDFFIENRRYKPLFKSNDPVKWAVGLQKVTYATSETYAETLIKLMNQWNLK